MPKIIGDNGWLPSMSIMRKQYLFSEIIFEERGLVDKIVKYILFYISNNTDEEIAMKKIPGLTFVKSSPTYVVYNPHIKGKNKIFFNDEAKTVFCPPVPEGENAPVPQISSLCEKWRKILDETENSDAPKDEIKLKGYIDVIQSWRRKYVVKGMTLCGDMSFSKKGEKIYLFIIERLNLKKWNLSPREQQIVRLIIEDLGNKEIADHLGISLNTVKGYLKLLMRKIGVHTRAGLIAAILTGGEENK